MVGPGLRLIGTTRWQDEEFDNKRKWHSHDYADFAGTDDDDRVRRHDFQEGSDSNKTADNTIYRVNRQTHAVLWNLVTRTRESSHHMLYYATGPVGHICKQGIQLFDVYSRSRI